jgi:hypothetical protein
MRSGRLLETHADRAKWGVGDILRLTGLIVRTVVAFAYDVNHLIVVYLNGVKGTLL